MWEEISSTAFSTPRIPSLQIGATAAKQWPPLKLLPEEVDDLHAPDEASYAPRWAVAGGDAALGKMRKTPSPSSEPAA